jgi:iron complex outermembrane receptor protein
MHPFVASTTLDLAVHRACCRAVATCALLAVTSAAALAEQAAGTTSGAPAGDGGSATGLEEIVVTARKREESLTEAPVAIYALGRADLERYAVGDVVAAAKLTPGLLLSRSTDNSSANIYLRGVGTSFSSISFEQAVATNIDNVPINKGRAIYQALFDTAQIEVMRGPQALFFGKNSTAGVIAIRTANPGDAPELSARTGYEFEGRQAYGELIGSTPLGETLGVRVALRGSTMDGGFFEDIGEELNGIPRDRDSPSEDEFAGRITLVYRPSDSFDLNFKFAGSDLENDGIQAYTQLVHCQGPDGTPQPILGFVPNQADGCKKDKVTSQVALDPEVAADFPGSRGGDPYSTYTGYVGALTAEYRWDAVSLTSVTGYYDYDTQSFADFNLGSASQTFGRELVDYRSLSEELRLASRFDGRFNFTTGLYFDDTTLDFSRAVRLFEAPPDPETGRTDSWDTGGTTDGKTFSVFVQAEFQVTPTIDVSGGARYSREEKDTTLEAFYASASTGLPFIDEPIHDAFDDDNVSPEVTLRWRPRDGLAAFASYKEGYKSGGSNLSEIAFAGTTSDTIHFESETAEGIELGIKGMTSDRAMSYSFAVYRDTYENLQVSIFDPVAVTLHVGNAGKYRVQGAELDLAWEVPTVDDLGLRASVYYNDSEFSDYIGACYTGQTIAQGCDEAFNAATGAYTSQDFEGRPGSHAPEWTVLVGADSEFALMGGGLRLGIGVDSRYTSSYYLGETLSPLQRQEEYVDLNAALRLMNATGSWEVALIGRNLLDELAGANAIDHPLTGSGTGTDIGTRADTSLVTGRPLEIALQGTVRF